MKLIQTNSPNSPAMSRSWKLQLPPLLATKPKSAARLDRVKNAERFPTSKLNRILVIMDM